MCLGIGGDPKTFVVHRAVIVSTPNCRKDSTNSRKLFTGEGIGEGAKIVYYARCMEGKGVPNLDLIREDAI
jgi:hypothetical protein